MEDAGDTAGGIDDIITEFSTYEEFLDSQITPLDLYYLEDEELARQLVELGYRGNGEVLKRDDFESRKQAAEEARQARKAGSKPLASAGKDIQESLLKALAQREEANRNGKIVTGVHKRSQFSWSGDLRLHRLRSQAED